MGCLRKEILAKGLSQKENSRIFHEIVESDILDALARKEWERVESILSRNLPDNSALEECLKCSQPAGLLFSSLNSKSKYLGILTGFFWPALYFTLFFLLPIIFHWEPHRSWISNRHFPFFPGALSVHTWSSS